MVERHAQKCASISEFLNEPNELRTESAARAAGLVPIPIYFVRPQILLQNPNHKFTQICVSDVF
jgi:hypothetical protein